MTFDVKTDRRLIRADARSTRHIVASYVAKASETTRQRAPINVALVLDRSGSMGGRKIQLAHQAVIDALRMLKPVDRFAVVCYDDQVEVIVESTHATSEAVRNAVRAVERIQARGNTDLAGGWLRGCEQIAEHLEAGGIGRCLLVTDGLANQGLTDPVAIERHAAELRDRHIVTSTFGIGADFNEVLLQRMATAGGGHPYFIEVAANIRDALTGEVGEALEVTERDVEIAVDLPAGAAAEVITMHPNQLLDPVHLVVRLGDLVAQQEVSVVLALKYPAGEEGTISNARFTLRHPGAQDEVVNVPWSYRSHDENDRQARDVEVDRAVARAYAARVRQQAAALNERGDYQGARVVLLECAKKIRSYAGADSELLEIAGQLEADAQRYAEVMSPMMLKQARYASYNVSMAREPDGKAKRRMRP